MRFLMAKLPSRLTDRMAGTMITLGNSVTTARWRATVRPTTKITNDVSVRATKRLPITSPFSWKTSGPGTTPKMIITPRKTAAPTLPGIPSAIVHTRSPGMQALVAVSEAITPSGSPAPNVSGCVDPRLAAPHASSPAELCPTAGSTPTKRPMAAARVIAHGDLKYVTTPSQNPPASLPIRDMAPSLSARTTACVTAKSPTRAWMSGMPSSIGREAQVSGHDVGPDRGEHQTEAARDQALDDRALDHGGDQRQRQQRRQEVLGRAELQRELGQRRSRHGQEDHPDEASGHGRCRAQRERRSALPALAHRIAVKDRGRVGGIARRVDEDGRDGAAIVAALVERAHKDERGGRMPFQDQRQGQRHAGRRAQARQHADDDAVHRAG